MLLVPRLTPDGDIILFNNFVTPERSSVLTLNPRTRRVVREYTGPKSEPLHSRRAATQAEAHVGGIRAAAARARHFGYQRAAAVTAEGSVFGQ